MSRIPAIIPISDLRQDAAKVMSDVRESDQVTVITQRGRATAVMMSVELYEQTQSEMEILKQISLGELEIQTGEGFGLEQVMAEADKLLGE